MPIHIVHQDITRIKCDAIVDPTDSVFSGSGGADEAIHMAAGPKLRAACDKLRPLSFGETAVTPAFGIPARNIIHTVGPVWNGGYDSEPMLLRSCYVNSLIKAVQLRADSVAFPLISSGSFGFPKDRVLRIAIDAISDFLFTTDADMTVYICVHDRESFTLSREIALRDYLDCNRRVCASIQPMSAMAHGNVSDKDEFRVGGVGSAALNRKELTDLSEWIKKQDDTFAVLLFKLIDKKGMGDVECYKKANVSKNTFWKINNDAKYKPSKPTVISFAIALELTLEETAALLRSAGFALSRNNLFDMIIEFYISRGEYDIFEINSALYRYDQPCLGV